MYRQEDGLLLFLHSSMKRGVEFLVITEELGKAEDDFLEAAQGGITSWTALSMCQSSVRVRNQQACPRGAVHVCSRDRGAPLLSGKQSAPDEIGCIRKRTRFFRIM